MCVRVLENCVVHVSEQHIFIFLGVIKQLKSCMLAQKNCHISVWIYHFNTKADIL